MHPHATRRYIALVLLSLCSLGVLTGCNESSSTNSEVLVTRDCASEPLRRAVDLFRVQPSDATKRAVVDELTALEEHIGLLMDHAEIAEGKAKAQYLCDAEAMRIALKFNIQRFNAPIEEQPRVAISRAEKSEAEEAPKAIAVAATPVEEMPVRRAIAVADTPSRAALAMNSDIPAELPVRRAIPVNSASTSSAPRAIIVQSGHRITIWHSTTYSSEIARR